MKTHPKIEWEFLVDRAYVPLSYSLNAFLNNRKYINKHYLDISPSGPSGQIFYPNDAYWPKGFKDEVANKQIEHHKKEGNKYLWKMADICEKRGEKLINDLKAKISRKLVEKLNANELERLFVWAFEEIKDFSVFITIPWSLQDYLDELIRNIVQDKVPEKKIPEAVRELLYPLKVNSSSRESEAMLELASEIKKRGDFDRRNKGILKKAELFVRDWGWVHVRWFKGTPLTVEDVVERLAGSVKEDPEAKLKELIEVRRRAIKYLEDFSKKHSLTAKEKDTIMLIKEYVYIRTYRTDTLSQAFFIISSIIERSAELLGLTIDDALYHSEAELRMKLRGENIDVSVSKRRESWAIIVIDDEYKIYSGKEAVEKLKKENNISRDLGNTSEIKGQSAFKGKVKGRVRVVLDPNDVSKVERGDILIAVMTFPSYIAAMERAVAFVTDEGGILCHASIIAREMKKPCIISTKIGTKVLKDGDMVEVDAERGIVRIIKV